MEQLSKKFIPFHSIKSEKAIVVDGLHPKSLVLSHWKGANTHPSIAADTSGEIVLNAIKENFQGIDTPSISATHFDIDGFVGVFALFYPELAMEYFDVLKQMAIIGDFREFESGNEAAETALKLCCWMNTVEKEKFYRPFGEKEEMELCVEKFNYFLPLFPRVLTQLDDFKADWAKEYEEVKEGLNQLATNGKVSRHLDLGLFIRETSNPIHYYALFSETSGFDMVLSCYSKNRYELECKYTTWIDLASRKSLPRINLKPLADKLNELEQNSFMWKVDKITDTGPILRLEKEKLEKADRYANPTEREIYSSSIDKNKFVELVLQFLTNAFQQIEPKGFWTWEEMKINK
ncbi:MAG: DUF6687 family protein [Vicingaceae bacterium]